MYTQEMLESIKNVEATRPARVGVLPERLTAEQKELLEKYAETFKNTSTSGAQPVQENFFRRIGQFMQKMMGLFF